jgi:hypothetical protein
MISPSGGSILMTLAPWSASKAVQTGPDTTVVRSMTRTPDNGPEALLGIALSYSLRSL